jgi:hypothetical protein
MVVSNAGVKKCIIIVIHKIEGTMFTGAITLGQKQFQSYFRKFQPIFLLRCDS